MVRGLDDYFYNYVDIVRGKNVPLSIVGVNDRLIWKRDMV